MIESRCETRLSSTGRTAKERSRVSRNGEVGLSESAKTGGMVRLLLFTAMRLSAITVVSCRVFFLEGVRFATGQEVKAKQWKISSGRFES